MHTPDHWYPEHGAGSLSRLQAVALLPLGALYDLAGRMRFAMTRPYDPGLPVICIGNLTAGGTGKTPLTIAIGHGLAALGHRPHILTRGHLGRLKGPVRVDPERHSVRDVGDEALLLAAIAPTWIARNRVAGARAATRAGADILLMDDGHQNPSLKKTLSLVVVDGEVGLGNGRVIPAGPLRESAARGLERTDAVVLMGEPGPRAQDQLKAWQGPVFHAHLEPQQIALQTGPYVAFAGIGRPEKFFATLKAMGAKLAARLAFPDHHVFSERDFEKLAARAKAAGARLITTEKDAVRLSEAARKRVQVLPVSAVISSHEAFGRFLIEQLESKSRMLRNVPADI